MSQQKNNVVELQGNETTVKDKFIKIQEFVNDFYGSPEILAVKLQSLYFQFVNVMLENDACLLASYENELYALQNVIECLQYTTEDGNEETNKNQCILDDLRTENEELKAEIQRQTEQINMYLKLLNKK